MPTEIRWRPPVALSFEEARVARALTRSGKFYVFLREVRAELFDEAFQAELAAVYGPRGKQPLPAALLAMVTLLQAYDQIGDADAVVTAQMDRRWQLVLDCLGCERAPFSQGVLVAFRERMIAHDLDRKLLDRTVRLAKQTGKFGWQALRAALDSSPLVGAGRVQDTWNLIGRALATVATCAAKAVGVPRTQLLAEAGVTLLAAPSLKAALDIDWDDPTAQAEALARLLREVDQLEAWVATHASGERSTAALKAALTSLRRVLEQDLEPDPTTGQRRLRRGVASDRVVSWSDGEMRHGRKTRSRPFAGFKRHLVRALDGRLILEALTRPANEPEHLTLAQVLPTMVAHGPLTELFIDRGYLASPVVGRLAGAGTQIRSKAWQSRPTGRYGKEAFVIDLVEKRVTCPAGAVAAIGPDTPQVRFPTRTCAACVQRGACLTAGARRGRAISLHPQEALLQRLRAESRTAEGRAALRLRTGVEHSLARVGQIQGTKARYKGVRKNTLDVRRCAAVANLQEVARVNVAA